MSYHGEADRCKAYLQDGLQLPMDAAHRESYSWLTRRRRRLPLSRPSR
jgi:hypothetical protein